MSSQNRFPGYDYLDRVGQAWLSAMGAQVQSLNDAWSQIRQGKYDHGSMMRGWAQSAESFYDTVVEVSRGPGYVYQPVWLCFDYTRAGQGAPEVPETLEDTVRIARTEAGNTLLEATRFAAMDLHVSAPDFYDTCDWADGSRSQIHVKLNLGNVRNADPGQYISFILPKGRTGEAPLVIVMLRISTR